MVSMTSWLLLMVAFTVHHFGGAEAVVVVRSVPRMISERVIPQYMETAKFFESSVTPTRIRDVDQPVVEYARCPNLSGDRVGHLISHSSQPLFSREETDAVIEECEARAREMGWTTSRHANYPTTDVPLAELPKTLDWFKNKALPLTIYPFLSQCFDFALPDSAHLRVVDAFVVKYNATGGQTLLKPHRDGSVVSFNIALNSLSEYEGGGTWFEGLQTSLRSDRGHVLTHASGLLHGGHPITGGVRYILVAFVILRSYPNFASRFYEHVRDL